MADAGVVDPGVDAAEAGDRRLRRSRSTCWRSATSHATAIACPPAPVMRSTMSLSVCSLRAASTTFAPCFGGGLSASPGRSRWTRR